MIRHADHIAGIGRLGNLAVLGHEHHRIVDVQLPAAGCLEAHAAPELAGAETHEGHAVTVVRIHVRLDLEHKAADRRVACMHADRLILSDRFLVTRRRSISMQCPQEFGDTEIAQRRSKDDRRHIPGAECACIEGRQQAAGHLDALSHLGKHVSIKVCPQACLIARDFGGRTNARRLPRTALELKEYIAHQVQHAGKTLATGRRPVEGRRVKLQLVLDLVEQRDRLQRLAVHLVDEGDDRDVPHPADFKQFQRLGLDTLCGIEYHDGAIGRRQCPVGIFRKILMARRIEQVEHETVKLESHHRG